MQKFIAEPSFWEILPEASIGIMVVRAMKTADEVSSEDKAAIDDKSAALMAVSQKLG